MVELGGVQVLIGKLGLILNSPFVCIFVLFV